MTRRNKSRKRITHIIRADNVCLFATTVPDMVHEIPTAMYEKLLMRWKGQQYAEKVKDEDEKDIVLQDLELGIISFKTVKLMTVLGGQTGDDGQGGEIYGEWESTRSSAAGSESPATSWERSLANCSRAAFLSAAET